MSQVLPLREQLSALERLQELDLKIDGLKKKRATIPGALKALDDVFNKARVALETKRGAIAELEKLERQAQAAMDLNKDRVSRANAKLESVQNTQEFQAASRELEQLRKQAIQLEDQIKKGRSDIEAAQKDEALLVEGFEKAKAARDAQAAELDGQTGQVDGEVSSLLGERQKHTVSVETRILSQYDRVRTARGGLGIVPAVGGRCSGCNMMVPPQLYNEVQKALQVHQCPSCHRILFVPAANGSGRSASEPASART